MLIGLMNISITTFPQDLLEKIMNKVFSSLIIGLIAVAIVPVNAEDSPHEFSANVSLHSDYLYRGIS